MQYTLWIARLSTLKGKLADKLEIDPCFITRILWVNSKGSKVVVDDNTVQQTSRGADHGCRDL
jgi:hypothetical protein